MVVGRALQLDRFYLGTKLDCLENQFNFKFLVPSEESFENRIEFRSNCFKCKNPNFFLGIFFYLLFALFFSISLRHSVTFSFSLMTHPLWFLARPHSFVPHNPRFFFSHFCLLALVHLLFRIILLFILFCCKK